MLDYSSWVIIRVVCVCVKELKLDGGGLGE